MLSRRIFMNGYGKPIRLVLGLLVLALPLTAWAQQDSSGQAPSAGQSPDAGQSQDNGGAPPAAIGPSSTAGDQTLENPPLSGLDSPRAEPAFGGRSYLVPALQLNEGVQTYSGDSETNEVTRVLGSLDLQKLWKSYQVALDYIGGFSYYTGTLGTGSRHWNQSHTLASDQRIPWRTGQLVIRDSFSYLPEGSFGFGSYGGSGGFTTGLGAGGVATGLGGAVTGGAPSGFFGGGQYFGYAPYIQNVAVLDAVEELSPRSTFTAGGGFTVTNYLSGSDTNSIAGLNSLGQPINGHLINSEQTTGQLGYNHTVGRKDQVGILYAFQELHFPTSGSGSIDAHVVSVMYSHRISGKLNFVAGGGPEFLTVNTPAQVELVQIFPGFFIPLSVPASSQKSISGDASVSLDYTWSARTSLTLSFLRYVTTGSGFFAGANTDAVRLAMSHALTQKWSLSGDGGYSENSRLLNLPNGPAGTSSRYRYWYAGASIKRQLGPHFDVFGSYQFDDFVAGGCDATVCGSHEQIAIGGITWHPLPIRLD